MARMRGMVLDALEAVEVVVEARASVQLRPNDLKVVGLADASVREGMLRARSAVWSQVSTAAFALGHGVLVNLAPADLKKSGRSLDLPLALCYAGLLLGIEDPTPSGLLVVGELGLGGSVRGVPGVVAAVLLARRLGRTAVVVPRENLAEARLVSGPDLYPVSTVAEALGVLRGTVPKDDGPRGPADLASPTREVVDLADVKGQFLARRALEIAAAGGHNLLFEGPPGSGKTLLARRLPGLLPRLDDDQVLEAALVRSVAGELDPARLHEPPFRSPHHSATPAGLTGGGQPIRPGEFSQAHLGVLFLDEFPEFDRRALEVLREPLEEHVVHVVRASGVRRLPADFLCIAAMNPCPCGFHGLGDGRCKCTPLRVNAYRARISGPLLDRFDLRVALRPVPADALFDDAAAEATAPVRARVEAARNRQRHRFSGRVNGRVGDRELRRAAGYGARERAFLIRAVAAHGLSARGARRLERVARTIADLAGSEVVGELHLVEALGYRLGGELEAHIDAGTRETEGEGGRTSPPGRPRPTLGSS